MKAAETHEGICTFEQFKNHMVSRKLLLHNMYIRNMICILYVYVYTTYANLNVKVLKVHTKVNGNHVDSRAL